MQLIAERSKPPATAPSSTASSAADTAFQNQPEVEEAQYISAAAVATQLEAASQQGVELSQALQEQLKALGVDLDVRYGGTSSIAGTVSRTCTSGQQLGDGSIATSSNGTSSSSGAASAHMAVVRDVLVPGGMSTALQLAKARRAAAAAAAATSSSSS
ncbi:hypothetical protein COO60DRAFT_1547903 [Scenedesmus sp. NREL 46B-D3]|nr:hypothetical protein COO60DRAFT_1547903 [Scenedesmus sp. NREL 46B-D3]